MSHRSGKTAHPGLEPLERRLPLSAGTAIGPQAHDAAAFVSSDATRSTAGYLLYRITNPNRFNNKLTPPFGHVLVQDQQPIPGQTYNLLYVVVRNGTAKTFDASNGFQVRLPQQPTPIPILTGNQVWKPGQHIVFYVLTKKYYPLPSQIHSGFVFNLGGPKALAIPGPSGIFLRLTYQPATFARTLDAIVAFGAGAQGGKGPKFGMPDTAINELVSAKTRKQDFGGYF
jgi:hypothetical protein